MCKLNCLELKISPTKVTIAKESIIPTYGGKWVTVLKIGTNIIAANPKTSMVDPYLISFISSFGGSKLSLNGFKKLAITRTLP
ncbi:hypothetical protein N9K77_01035 [bacterium]|nr:hypothetical protein [bacterium]